MSAKVSQNSHYCLIEHLHSKPQVVANTNELRLLSLNIAHGRKKRAHQLFLPKKTILANLDDIAAVIQREKPHLVALQEADFRSVWNGNFNHVEYLAEQTGFHYSLHGFHMHRLRLNYGTALLSRYSIEQPFSLRFPSTRPLPAKGFVVGSLALGSEQRIDVASLHFDFARKKTRQRQAERLLKVLAARGHPAIVMGDFNCEWASPGSALRHMVDAQNLRAHQPAETSQATFPATNKRWDWIIVPPQIQFEEYRVLSDTLSDHRAVFARVRYEVTEQSEEKTD